MQVLGVTYLFALSAGLVSVLSPCVLPIIPIIVTGKTDDSKFRPLLIVLGLTLTFVLMGIISTLFGNIISPYVFSLEKVSGVVILLFGLLMLFNLNPMKGLSFFQRINYNGKGIFSGFILGMVLGLVWIPCVGPVLSSILAMVATSGSIKTGIISLLVYSFGFSIPLLLAAYFAHFFRTKFSVVKKNPNLVRYVSGGILTLFGFYIIVFGLVNFSFS